MKLLKTEKETLSDKDILKYIADYERDVVPELDKLWQYYEGENVKIRQKKIVDANNPDNRIPLAYGRKIINTFVGYARKAGLTTYKASVERDESLDDGAVDENGELLAIEKTSEELFVDELADNFKKNKERIKTSRAGRNMGIFGMSYELVYVDRTINKETLQSEAWPRFFTVDPREMIILYDYQSEPEMHIAIRFYMINKFHYKVEVYYKDKINIYDRTRDDDGLYLEWKLTPDKEDPQFPNFFNRIPVAAYYNDDDKKSLITPVLDLIDALDVLYSDSMNEFSKFAYAYLIMKKFGLTDPTKMKTPGVVSLALQALKQKRIFENLPENADIKFLTKDIPTGFITYMNTALREQIHEQSHVPDFNKMTGALSGAAIDRLLFDFENMVSSMDTFFDEGLYARIELVNIIFKLTSKHYTDDPDSVVISHKRNKPQNLPELAQTASTMKQAGFSAYVIADIMPDDVIPDVQAELRRQQRELEDMRSADVEGEAFDANDFADETNPMETEENVE